MIVVKSPKLIWKGYKPSNRGTYLVHILCLFRILAKIKCIRFFIYSIVYTFCYNDTFTVVTFKTIIHTVSGPYLEKVITFLKQYHLCQRFSPPPFYRTIDYIKRRSWFTFIIVELFYTICCNPHIIIIFSFYWHLYFIYGFDQDLTSPLVFGSWVRFVTTFKCQLCFYSCKFSVTSIT